MKNRIEFIEYLKTNDCKVGVEIGSYRGEYAKSILDGWNGYLYLVDVWRYLPNDEYTDVCNQENPKEIINGVFDNLQGYEDRTILIRADSNSASRIFQNNFFDFIYIDANHKYDYVLNDMKMWFPKLKKGGIFAGHDYIADYNEKFADENGDTHVWIYDTYDPTITSYAGLFGVNKAVKDFCNAINTKFETTIEEYFQTWYFKKDINGK